MDASTATKFNVGGVLLDQPFKIRRLCHFGFNLYKMTEGLHFYRNLLGFRITDIMDQTRGGKVAIPDSYKEFGDINGYFMRYAHDHHAFVLYNHRYRAATDKFHKPEVTMNQLTWQVQSLRETVDGYAWFAGRGETVVRAGRDMPGSNWHAYLMDPDQHKNEICYGMEQIGWDGHSKPRIMGERAFHQSPSLPQIAEYTEVNEAVAKGTDLLSGFRDVEDFPLTHDVGGVLLARPFRIVKHGPVGLFVEDIDASLAWYRDVMGFTLTEETIYQGHRCLFLRNGTEHHSLSLLPIALRSVLGFRPDSTIASFGVQFGTYQQLLDAAAFLKSHGVTLRELPPELTPGMDHTILAHDPDGHAVQLYWSMEQVGWDGKPRPAASRRKIVQGAWPKALEANADSYTGEPLLGPWG